MGVNPPHARSAHPLEEISVDKPPRQPKVKVWVYYNPTNGEAILYDGDPPPSFSHHEHDIGPIELDEELIDAYVTARISGTRRTQGSSPPSRQRQRRRDRSRRQKKVWSVAPPPPHPISPKACCHPEGKHGPRAAER